MIKLLWGLAYTMFIILVSCLIPVIMIPILQDYGLYARDVVGFCVMLIFLADLLLMGFGVFMWSVLS